MIILFLTRCLYENAAHFSRLSKTYMRLTIIIATGICSLHITSCHADKYDHAFAVKPANLRVEM